MNPEYLTLFQKAMNKKKPQRWKLNKKQLTIAPIILSRIEPIQYQIRVNLCARWTSNEWGEVIAQNQTVRL